MRAAILDTGPLVAFLDRAEQHHRWVAERIEELDTPLLVCEPVLAAAMHLLARFSRAQDALFGLFENGALTIANENGGGAGVRFRRRSDRSA
jgi:predicted nucleic acid-binding protein